MIFVRHRNFTKRLAKLSSQIEKAFINRAELFSNDAFHPLLHNHFLTGKYAGKRSINITGDYRVIFRQEGETVIFLEIGTHHELFGS